MDLFLSSSENLLPYDGVVVYLGKIIPTQESLDYLEALKNTLPWSRDEVIIYGKKILARRMVVWCSDYPLPYKYSGVEKYPIVWTKELLELKSIVEKYSQESFNSCLLNYYTSGREGMSWHSDDESSLVRHGTIASLSLGAERRFLFRHKKTKEKLEIILEPGSLLLMKGETQDHWQHSLPISSKVRKPRINLTFRNLIKKS